VRWIAGLLGLALLLTACAIAASPAATAQPSAGAVHWAYEGEAGPERWGELSPDFATCAEGRAQSPIDVADVATRDLTNITFDYRAAPLEILDNGHTVQVNYAAGSSITVDAARFDLVQFHFHAPSEHAVGGAAAEAELHLVHRGADGRLAVVGVLLHQGDANPAYEPVFANLPSGEGPATVVPDVEVDAAELLPESPTTYRYAGSLTTPPCTEGVSWLLMSEPVAVSEEQLAALGAVVGGNNRPLQPVNDREVVEDSTP
jgi:carbonic anhydrase